MSTTIQAGNIKPRIQFTADGVQKEFQFFFAIYEPENVKVYIEDQLQVSGYTMLQNSETRGGVVVFTEAPAQGKLITIYRDLELKRTTDFKEGGPFRSSKVNSEFNYQLSCLEQLEDSIGRTVTFPQYAPTYLNVNLPMPSAGKSIIWNETEDSLVNSENKFDTVIEQSLQYCNETEQNLNTVKEQALAVSENLQSITMMKDEIAGYKNNASASASSAALSAAQAASNAVNSLYNQSETSANFTIVLKDGVSIYRTPVISSNVTINVDLTQLTNHANTITFEVYLCFSTFATVSFSGISFSWLNGKTPNLTQNNTYTKILTFRNKTPGDYSQWVASMEGGY